MQDQMKYLRYSNEFIVHEAHINDKGTLNACKILSEITKLYDQAIMHTFGDLNYYKINASSYHLDLIDIARAGDMIRLESEAIVHIGQSVAISITVHNSSNKDKPLAVGHFVFNRAISSLPKAVSLC